MAHVADRRSFDEVRHLPSFHEALPHIARGLTEACRAGDKARREAERVGTRKPSLFDGTEPATMSISDYLVRLCKYSNCSAWTMLVMRVYLARYLALGETGYVTSHSAHRLVLTCFVLAAKLRDDVYYANSYYAQVGGVSLRDMNKMEAYLLTVLNWETHVDTAELLQHGLISELPAPPTWGAHPLSAKRAPSLRVATERTPDVDDASARTGGDAFYTPASSSGSISARRGQSVPDVDSLGNVVRPAGRRSWRGSAPPSVRAPMLGRRCTGPL